jgi:hypothetical protein
MMCDKNNSNTGNLLYKALNIMLKLNGPEYQGSFYKGFLPLSDYVFWIEDANRNYIKTIKVTPTAVKVDSVHGEHLSHLPAWMAASGLTYADLQRETQDGIAPSFDAITSASISFAQDTSAQNLTAEWDLTDKEGNKVESGVFHCCAEVANIIKNDSVSYTVNAEHIFMKFDLENGTSEQALPTEHLLEMSVTCEEKNSGSDSGEFYIVGP